MNIRILRSANEDLADGFQFYEKQQPGLGIYFLESLLSDIDSLKIYAGIHKKVFLTRFITQRRWEVSVRAVLDCRRDPRWSQRKLRGE